MVRMMGRAKLLITCFTHENILLVNDDLMRLEDYRLLVYTYFCPQKKKKDYSLYFLYISFRIFIIVILILHPQAIM